MSVVSRRVSPDPEHLLQRQPEPHGAPHQRHLGAAAVAHAVGAAPAATVGPPPADTDKI